MKKVKITRTYEGWSEACPYCKKVIEGLSESQVKYNLKIHKLSCKRRKRK